MGTTARTSATSRTPRTGITPGTPPTPVTPRTPVTRSTRMTAATSDTPFTPTTETTPVTSATIATPFSPHTVSALPTMAMRPAERAPRDATGDRILEIAAEHLAEQYILGARAPMANSGWRGPWDCAEFASWCIFQATGSLYGVEPRNDPIRADAFTGFWATQAEAERRVISVEQAARTPGACVLRKPGANGIGHIVLADGKGGTVEAHSRNRGVVRDVLSGRRWDYGILVPGVQYFANEQAVEVKMPERVLRVMDPLMRGPTVQKVQVALAQRGFHPGSADGVYGPQTAHAVQAFQADKGLVPDGEVGPTTLKALGINES